ncbi:MAG: hypothetical protein EPO02_13665 [Nitrospirae bacterium]|nr:MAG: hypothetical protein EPO02_13665 [Nitrospirota bacterium]
MSTDIDYEPLTEEEALGLFPKGEYYATILEASKKPGKKDPSITYVIFKLNVESDKQHKEMTVYCFKPFMLRHAAYATDNGDKYESKTLTLSDFVGKSLNVKISVKEGDEKYPNPKNEIWDFVKSKAQENLPFDDVIPF